MEKFDYKKLPAKKSTEPKAPVTDELKKLQDEYIDHLIGKENK